MEYDFLHLVRRQFVSSDFDAEHPVCLWLIKKHGLSYRQSLWLSFLYMAFYDEASAWVVFKSADPFTIPTNTAFPIGMNRRNLFGGKIDQHFESLRQVAQTASDWPTHNFTGVPWRDWEILNTNLGTVWGNGRFAKYTTAEMLQKVAGVSVEITGFDNKDSSGPADGIARIYGCTRDIPTLDTHAEIAYNRVIASGLRPTYTTVDRGVVESVLCNFSGCCRNKFYSGRNVDRQQERIKRVEAMGHTLPDLWEARQAVFRKADLGELAGWGGIDRERLKSYTQTGKILWSHEGR